jgi:hypothetical protein
MSAKSSGTAIASIVTVEKLARAFGAHLDAAGRAAHRFRERARAGSRSGHTCANLLIFIGHGRPAASHRCYADASHLAGRPAGDGYSMLSAIFRSR